MTSSPNPSNELFDQVCFLYELSISVGTSLDLRENCSSLFSRVMSRRGLSYSALWLHVDREDPESELELSYSEPEREYDGEGRIAASVFQRAATAPGFSARRSEVEAAFPEFDLPHGESLTIVPLASIGYVVLAGPGDNGWWREWQLSQLKSIFDRFALALEASFAHQALREEVQQRIEAEERAESAQRARTEFLANLSHEIRTPMMGVLGFTEVLLERPDDGDFEGEEFVSRRTEAGRKIRENGDQLLTLVGGLLDLSKVESESTETSVQIVSPVTLVKEVVAQHQLSADAKRVDIELKFGRIPSRIQVDSVRLRQILSHLVGNAIKFTDIGRVTVACEPHGDTEISFAVADEGVGMTEEEIQRAFEPFTQVDASMTRRHGGTGLGLPLSHRLAERMGGRLVGSGEPKRGCCFRLTIPVVAASEDTPSPPPKPKTQETPSLEGRRVLLVEDGRDNQVLLRHFLVKGGGATVTLAINGLEAIAAVFAAEADGEPFDVVLMDMQMPVLDGYSATRNLRDSGFDRPILALTAHAVEGDKEKCLAAGCDAFLTKPIRRDDLCRAVSEFAQGLCESESTYRPDPEERPKSEDLNAAPK